MEPSAAICPQCDFIIDASFLEAAAEPPPPAAPPARTRTGTRPGTPRAGTRPPRRAAAPAPQSDGEGAAPESTAIKSLEEVEREHAARPARPERARPSAVAAEFGRSPMGAAAGSASGKSNVSDDALADFRAFVRELPMGDKLAFIGAGVAVLAAFLPWKETAADGDVLGLMSWGIGAVLLNIGALAAIVSRTRRSFPQMQPALLWLAQLGAICLALIWCLVFIKTTYDGRQVPASIGNDMMAISKPVFGVFLALLFQVVALAGTVLGLKEKSP